MVTVVIHSTGVITPEAVNGFEASREARTIVHHVLGRSDPDITFRPAGLRTGALTLVFASGAVAKAAETALRVPQVLSLVSDVPEVGMSFVVAGGDLQTKLDPETRVVWLVVVPFQEVAP